MTAELGKLVNDFLSETIGRTTAGNPEEETVDFIPNHALIDYAVMRGMDPSALAANPNSWRGMSHQEFVRVYHPDNTHYVLGGMYSR